jgi:acetyl-CoA synthetase
MNIKSFWINQSKNIYWGNKPKVAFNKKKNNFSWFPDGKLNVYQNCINENIKKGYGNKKAIYTVSSQGVFKSYTYSQLQNLVNNFSIILKKKLNKFNNNKKIMIHSSASIESAVSMLACSKLGIHFSVIFEELEEEAILKRINIFKPALLLTRKKNFLKNKKKLLKKVVHITLPKILLNKKIIEENSLEEKSFKSDRDFFTLFTSGSTGTPKGITHSYGGYFLYTKYTCEHQFGMNKNSIVLTASDAGWINGHTYALFGPLSFGATTILLEKPAILLELKVLEKIVGLKTSIFYIPVTLIRLMKSFYKKLNLKKKHINCIGSMGEPLAPSVGSWFAQNFKNRSSSIVNTYFQTETGGIICSPKFNQKISDCPHGSVGNPFSFINFNKITRFKKTEIKILNPWPGCMKNIINGKKEFKKYWDKNGSFRLFDLATKNNNNIYIHGRTDDVINIRGHRIGSEEIESIVLKNTFISECSAVSVPNKLEGYQLYLFIVSNKEDDNKINDSIINNFGYFALPKKIIYVSELPKTRSGKILRRLMRNMIIHNNINKIGDITTMINKDSIYEILKKLNG